MKHDLTALREAAEAPHRLYGWDAVYGEGAAGITEETKVFMGSSAVSFAQHTIGAASGGPQAFAKPPHRSRVATCLPLKTFTHDTAAANRVMDMIEGLRVQQEGSHE